MINSEKSPETNHVPDRRKLPDCVVGWKEMDTKRLWPDQIQLLVAVPVVDTRHPVQDWYYEFSVIVIKCDEDGAEIETTNGDAWGWEISSVDYYVVLSE